MLISPLDILKHMACSGAGVEGGGVEEENWCWAGLIGKSERLRACFHWLYSVSATVWLGRDAFVGGVRGAR